LAPSLAARRFIALDGFDQQAHPCAIRERGLLIRLEDAVFECRCQNLNHIRDVLSCSDSQIILYRIRGFDAKTVAKLRPYITALPSLQGHTTVNANTASATVLAALLPELAPADIANLIKAREEKPFRSKDDITRAAKNINPAALGALDVKSSFFSVRVRVAQDDVQIGTEALVQRDPAAGVAVVWRRPLY